MSVKEDVIQWLINDQLEDTQGYGINVVDKALDLALQKQKEELREKLWDIALKNGRTKIFLDEFDEVFE